MARYSITETDVLAALSIFNIPSQKMHDVVMSLDVDAIEKQAGAASTYDDMRVVAKKAIQEQFVSRVSPYDIADSITHDIYTRFGDKTAKSVLKSAISCIDEFFEERGIKQIFNSRKDNAESKIALLITVFGLEKSISILASFCGISFSKINLWPE